MPRLPTGTVTFLFTDIEGSTRLWEQQTARMQTALARHDQLLRTAIESNHGYVFKTVGDAFCGAFSTALEGFQAALDAQHAIGREQWDVPGGIRVRMALHTGSAEERDGDYFGTALNRIARLLSVGYGGQILVSLVTSELLRDVLPENAGLRDVGAHRLKDLMRPESVFQVVHPGLQSDFPQLKSLGQHPNNLPLQPTPFIGRERELESAARLLTGDACRVLTLTGVGGMGKTRLGLQTAANLTEHFEDGVYFVDLSAIDSPAHVIPAVARTFGLRESGGRSALDLIRDAMKDKRILLLLDNFEQVMGAVPHVVSLLAACPELKCLVTSREALHVRMENVLPVPPLSAPKVKGAGGVTLARLRQYEAVSLFIERAVSVRPDFSVTNRNAPAVAEICARLDGLPLAIELAAARITMLTPEAILERLGKRLKLLTGGLADLPFRQRTLRATIDWSYRMLSASEQSLFKEVSVFAGGATLDAVEKVCACEGGDVDVLETLSSLVDKSLVWREERPHGEPRFQMFESLREYGTDLIGEAGEKELLPRHAEYFLRLAHTREPELRGANQRAAFDALEAENDNFQAALDWLHGTEGCCESEISMCVALTVFYQVRGYLLEGRENIERARSRDREVPPGLRAKAFLSLARIANSQDRYAESLKLLDSSAAAFSEAGDDEGLLLVEYERGWVSYRLNEQDRAIAHYQAVISGAKEGDLYLRALAELGIGSCKCMTGELDEARACLDRCRVTFTRLGDDRSLVRTILSTLMISYQKGDFAGALRLCMEALEVQGRLNDFYSEVIVYNNLGSLHLHLGDYAESKKAYEKLLSLSSRAANSHYLVWAYAGLAESHLGLGEDAEALDNSMKAIALAEALDAPFDLGVSIRVLGEVHLRRGDYPRALQELNRSLPLVQKGGDDVEYQRTLKSIEKAESMMAAGTAEASERQSLNP